LVAAKTRRRAVNLVGTPATTLTENICVYRVNPGRRDLLAAALVPVVVSRCLRL